MSKRIDNYTCQCYDNNDKKTCQSQRRAEHYAVIKSFKGIPFPAESESDGAGQTISLIERGDYSPSVTLALKLAMICEVQVEDIFRYEEDGEDEREENE